MTIPFNQYTLPNGRRKEVYIDRSDKVEAKAFQLIAEGYKFEIEVLRSGAVSMTCEKDDVTGETIVLAHIICGNDRNVPEEVDNLVEVAYSKYMSSK